MLLKVSKGFIWLALFSPLIASSTFFFPFVSLKAIIFRVLVEIALVLAGMAYLRGEWTGDSVKERLKTPLTLTTAVFIALFLAACLAAQNPAYAFWSNFERGEGGWQMLHYVIFFILLKLTHRTKSDWRSLVRVQLGASVLMGLYTVAQAYTIGIPGLLNPPGPISGSLGNPSYLGWYMVVSFFLTLWLANEETDKTYNKMYKSYRSYIFGLVALFQLAVIIAAKSRGSLIALGAGLIFLVILWILRNKNSKAIFLRGAGVLVGIAALTIVSAGIIKGGSAGLSYAWQNFQPRLWTWGTALKGITEKPVRGWGAEHFNLVFDRYYDPRHDTLQPWFDRAHNAFLEYAVSGGIPLLLAYLALLTIAARKTQGLLAALPLVYAINGLVLFEILPVYILLFLFLAMIDGYNQTPQSLEGNFPKISRVGPLAYASMVPLAAITSALIYYTAYLPFHKNRLMLATSTKTSGEDIEIFMAHDAALKAPGPVGQEEALQNLLAFGANYWDYLKKNNLVSKVSKEKRKQIIAFINTWYEAEKNKAIGVRSLYLYAAMLILEMETSDDREYVARAEALIQEGKAKAPHRLEFVRLASALQQLQ